MASNTCLAGLVEYLQGRRGVREVEVRPGKPATAADISGWERSSKCALPEDLRMFYLIHNGLDLHWSYLHNEHSVSLGRVHMNPLGDLRPLVTPQSHTQSMRQPSLLDLEPDSDDRGHDGEWCPSLSAGSGCSVYVLDYCHASGHTCLVFRTSQSVEPKADCSVWLLDLGLSWHRLGGSFSDYLRLAVVHLGLRQWPYAVTPNKLSPEYEYWFHVFIPNRLETDMTGGQSTRGAATRQNEGGGDDVAATRENERGGDDDIVVVVDVSKILQSKPKRLRDVKSATKQQPASSRRSSTTRNIN